MTKTTKNIVLIALLALLVTGGAVGVGYWQVSQIGGELETAIARVNQNEELLQQKAEIESLSRATADERAQLETFILTEEEAVNFLNDIETIAARQGIEFGTDMITEPTPTDTPLFSTVQATFQFSGPEIAVLRLIDLFETLPHLARLTQLEMRQEGEVWRGRLSIKMTLLTP